MNIVFFCYFRHYHISWCKLEVPFRDLLVYLFLESLQQLYRQFLLVWIHFLVLFMRTFWNRGMWFKLLWRHAIAQIQWIKICFCFSYPSISEKTASNIMKIIVLVLGIIISILTIIVEQLGSIFQVAVIVGGVTAGSLLGLFTMGMTSRKANSIVRVPWIFFYDWDLDFEFV